MAARPESFALSVPDQAIADLRDRLARTRFPDQAPGEPWAYGTDVAYLQALVDYWRDRFDWRAQEARLNAFPQYKVPLHGIDLHFLHVPGKGPDPCPLLLSHGWPGSVFEFLELIPRLTDPARFGGDPADAFTVVAPSLPGYGLSFAPGQPRFGVEAIADCFAELMTGVLGYRRFAAQGGDWGAFVTARLGYAHADRLIGIHLNLLPVRRDPAIVADPTPEERRYLDELAHWLKEETGYQWIQGTRPQTLAFGADRLAGGTGRVDRREVPRLVRLRRRRRERVHARTSCWPTSASTGSPARSARRSGPTTRACTGRGRSPRADDRGADGLLPSSRARSCARRARWPSAPSPTSGAGP